MPSHVWLFMTLWTIDCQAPQYMEFPRYGYYSGLSFPLIGELPNPGIEPKCHMSPTIADGLFTIRAKKLIRCASWYIYQFSSTQSLSRVWLFVTPWIAAHQASLCITNFWSLPRLMSSKSVMPSSHLIFCRPLLLLPPIPPSIRVFSSESTLLMRWPKYWSFSQHQSFQWTPRTGLL